MKTLSGVMTMIKEATNMKKTIISLSALTIAVALTTSFTSCSNEDLTVIQQPTEQTHTICIPATFDNGTRAVTFDDGDAKGGKPTNHTLFKENEDVFVYNITKRAMLEGSLNPSDISEDGKTCNLTGELDGDIDEGDKLKLLYNLSDSDSDPESCFVEYSFRTGEKETIVDAAEATVTVSNYTDGVLTTTKATLQPVQSIFRFNFVDEKGKPINIKKLDIESKNNALVGYYYPLKEGDEKQNEYDRYEFTFNEALSGNIYLDIRINENKNADDVLKFVVTDKEGNVYRCTKKAPKGGFKNGKYYYSTSAFKLTKELQHAKPTVDWTNVKDGVAVSPDESYCYNVYGPTPDNVYDASEITLKGNCTNYWFKMLSEATIHFNGLTATCYGENQFINSDYNVTLDINGDNTIICEETQVAVNANTLRLRGDGTLTVCVRCYGTECGIKGNNNYNHTHGNKYDEKDEIDMTKRLAATGYTVTRSERKFTEYGTYTWTYTVKPE